MKRTSVVIDRATVHIVSTDQTDGDFRVIDPAPDLVNNRDAIVSGPWTALRQIHGNRVVTVERAGSADMAEADAAVTFEPHCPISVVTADCAPIVLVGSTGVAVIHAGWRGAAAGIVQGAAEALQTGGSEPVATFVGPCIQPGAYEFGAQELDALADRFGPHVRATTDRGAPALDLHAMVTAACVGAGWPAPARSACTSHERYFSHRTRADVGRQATVAWIDV